MEGPDPTLTAIYGTVPAGQEKTAEDKAIENLSAALEAESVDFTKLSAEEQSALLETAQQATVTTGQPAAPAAGAPAAPAESTEADKEAQAKFAEADFMGRVIAHSQWDELRKIAEVNGTSEATPAQRVTARLIGEQPAAASAEKTAAETANEAIEAVAQERVGAILEELGIDPSQLQQK